MTLWGVSENVGEVAAPLGAGGRIVNVASASGAVADPWMAAYCASKAEVIMLTKPLRSTSRLTVFCSTRSRRAPSTRRCCISD